MRACAKPWYPSAASALSDPLHATAVGDASQGSPQPGSFASPLSELLVRRHNPYALRLSVPEEDVSSPPPPLAVGSDIAHDTNTTAAGEAQGWAGSESAAASPSLPTPLPSQSPLGVHGGLWHPRAPAPHLSRDAACASGTRGEVHGRGHALAASSRTYWHSYQHQPYALTLVAHTPTPGEFGEADTDAASLYTTAVATPAQGGLLSSLTTALTHSQPQGGGDVPHDAAPYSRERSHAPAGATEQPTPGPASGALAGWPSSPAMRKAHRAVEEAAAVGARPARGDHPASMVPAPKSAALRARLAASPPTLSDAASAASDARPATATTATTSTRAGPSYLAAVLGGARAAALPPTVTADHVPLPRSKRAVPGSHVEAMEPLRESALSPLAKESGASPALSGSHARLSDVLASTVQGESTVGTACGSAAATHSEAHRSPSPSSTAAASSSTVVVAVASSPPSPPAGAARRAGEQRGSDRQPPFARRGQPAVESAGRARRKAAEDDWILVRPRERGRGATTNSTTTTTATAATTTTGLASTRASSRPGLLHSSVFDLLRRGGVGRVKGSAAAAPAARRPTAPTAAAVAKGDSVESDESSEDGAARAAVWRRSGVKKESAAGGRRARQREEAALLEVLATRADAAPAADAASAAASSVAHVATSASALHPRTSVDPAAPAGETSTVSIVGIPILALGTLEELLPSAKAPASTARSAAHHGTSNSGSIAIASNVYTLLSLLQRGLSLGDSPSAKALVLQRAVGLVTDAVARQAPALACAVLLEASDSFTDLERSLQCCQRALRIAEPAPKDTSSALGPLAVFEMLARLSTTRTLARVIDTSDAKDHLLRAAELALALGESPTLGWIALQLGITLELSGDFYGSLVWYEAADGLARRTMQPRLLCDVLCCQSIAYYAVGETALSTRTHAESVALLSTLPRAWHSRPLQNFVQFKLQAGDMAGALEIHETELALAREQGDAVAAARCLGSIALAKKYLGRYQEAAAAYLAELDAQHTADARQSVESLTGAASCFLLAGHASKALDYCRRAVRQAALSYEQCTMAKALLELAEVELHMGARAAARGHVVDALDAMSRIDAAERRQYLVKATLCELEWRCCSTLQRLAWGAEPPRAMEALLYSDLCNVPNTANTQGLLRRRMDMYGGVAARAPGASGLNVEPASFLTRHLVPEEALVALLRDEAMTGRKLVCFSLPWAEESVCMAFIVSLAAPVEPVSHDQGPPQLHVEGVPLALTDEVSCLLASPSALNAVFDAPMMTLDAEPRRLYGDTPLWPQRYSKAAFDHEARQSAHASGGEDAAGGDARSNPLKDDALYCLQLLYQTFIAPIEPHLQSMEPVRDDGAGVTTRQPVRGLTFVGDGIFGRIPFHALHDGSEFLTTRFSISTCCSLALLTMLHAAMRRQGHAGDGEKDGHRSRRAAPTLARVVGVAAAAEHWAATSVLASAAAAVTGGEEGGAAVATGSAYTVDHVSVDEGLAGLSSAEPAARATDADTSFDSTAITDLLARTRCGGRRDRTLRNSLYAAVHAPVGAAAGADDDGEALAARPRLLLELNLPVVPEVREDFCGYMSASDSAVCVGHSMEIAHTWDLHRYALVVCGGCGTYSGLSIHETGIPVYRSLQYAGAPRVLVPVGSRLPTDMRVAAAAALAEGSVADAIQAEHKRCIAAGVPLSVWACYTLCGLP